MFGLTPGSTPPRGPCGIRRLGYPPPTRGPDPPPRAPGTGTPRLPPGHPPRHPQGHPQGTPPGPPRLGLGPGLPAYLPPYPPYPKSALINHKIGGYPDLRIAQGPRTPSARRVSPKHVESSQLQSSLKYRTLITKANSQHPNSQKKHP